MKTIGQIFNELNDEGFFNKHDYIGIDSMLSVNDFSKYKLSSVNSNKCFYGFNIRNFNDIVLNKKFNIVFDIKNPEDYQKTNCEIDFVSLKRDDTIGVIPKGYGGIVRLKFNDKVPEITKVLKQDEEEKFDKEKHSYLYFTTQEVMDKILEELDTKENQIS